MIQNDTKSRTLPRLAVSLATALPRRLIDTREQGGEEGLEGLTQTSASADRKRDVLGRLGYP